MMSGRSSWRWGRVVGGKRIVKVKVVRIKGRDEIVEKLRATLRGFGYAIGYDDVEREDEDVRYKYRYKYEVLHANGYADNVYVAITCDNENCRVEAPIYRFLIEPCYSKPTPAELIECINKVASNAKKIEGLVKELHSMVQELVEYGYDIHRTIGGAEAYWSKVDEGTKSHIRVHLSPRTSILQLQVEAEPAKIVEVAKVLTKLVR
jgi:hypothetical protein